MKKLKNLDYGLSLGIAILFIAVISLFCGENIKEVFSLIGLISISGVFFLLALLFKNVLQVPISSRSSYACGCLTLIATHIFLGTTSLFGNWFSFAGDGCRIFLASIALLVIILSLLTMIIYKNYKMIHIIFLALIFSLYNVLAYFGFSIELLYLIISSIILIINIFKINNTLYNFSSIYTYINVLGCLFSYDNIYLFTTTLIINLISLFVLLKKDKSFESELLSLIIFWICLFVYSSVIGDILNANLVSVILIFIICVFELLLNTFKVLRSDFNQFGNKVVALIFLYTLLPDAFIPQLIVISFIMITSLANAFLIGKQQDELYFLPLKLAFLIHLAKSLTDLNIIAPLLGIYGLVISLITLFIKDKKANIYTFISVIAFLLMFDNLTESLVHLVVGAITLTGAYLCIDKKYKLVDKSSLFFSLIYILGIYILSLTKDFSSILVLILLFSLVTFLKHKSKYNIGVNLLFLWYLIITFNGLVIVNYDVLLIVNALLAFVFTGIGLIMLELSNKQTNILYAILYSLIFLKLLDESSFLVIIFSLIISLVLLLVSLNKENLKSLFYLGIIFGVLNVLAILSLLDNISTSVYLLLVAVLFIVIISALIYKFQKAEEKSVCPNCHTKNDANAKYCENCGKKLK